MKTLVVAEKPSVGRDIARVLGANTAGQGCLKGQSYDVTWAVGHLVTLVEPDELDAVYKRWSFETLPILPEKIPLKVISSSKAQFNVVKALMKSADYDKIVCATDAGREGELIFRYIYTMAGCVKPVMRLWISSMTDAAIKAGFGALKSDSEYDSLYASAHCRSEADWLVGMNASRAFTLRYNVLLSVGRVQTPTLALIVRRDAEIAAFVPEPYWEVKADFGAYTGTWFDPKTNETRIKDEERAKEITKKVKGKTGTVISCEKTKKTEAPPRLYDLTLLQREANSRFGYSAAKTLDIAQALYEKHKIITYPRTDSNFLTDDMIPKVAKTLSLLPEPYKPFVDKITPIQKSNRIYDASKVSDHHAIIPTDHMAAFARLSTEERNVFDLVARRLIANHYPDRVYNSCRIVTEAESERFRTDCIENIDLGWRELYANDKTKDGEALQGIPNVSKGDAFQIKKAECVKKSTKPPEAYTDGTLLKAMESAGKTIEDEELRRQMQEYGLGTPATRAATIQRLIDVKYVERVKKTLRATEKGKNLIRVAPPELTEALTTGKWERALNKMSKLSDSTETAQKVDRFMGSIRAYSEYLVSYARKNAPYVQFPPEEKNYAKKGTTNGAKAAGRNKGSGAKDK